MGMKLGLSLPKESTLTEGVLKGAEEHIFTLQL
jgi:hypothetical protein